MPPINSELLHFFGAQARSSEQRALGEIAKGYDKGKFPSIPSTFGRCTDVELREKIQMCKLDYFGPFIGVRRKNKKRDSGEKELVALAAGRDIYLGT